VAGLGTARGQGEAGVGPRSTLGGRSAGRGGRGVRESGVRLSQDLGGVVGRWGCPNNGVGQDNRAGGR